MQFVQVSAVCRIENTVVEIEFNVPISNDHICRFATKKGVLLTTFLNLSLSRFSESHFLWGGVLLPLRSTKHLDQFDIRKRHPVALELSEYFAKLQLNITDEVTGQIKY